MNLTIHIPGDGVCRLARKLGVPCQRHIYKWVRKSNYYPASPRYNGIMTTEEGAAKINAALEEKAAKAELKRYRQWLKDHQPKELLDQQRRKAQAAAEKRRTRELNLIKHSVAFRWTLAAEDLQEFAEHANQPGSDRILRKRDGDFDKKVYMALVAWVRHNYTNYDALLNRARDDAYSEYVEAKEGGADRWEKSEALDKARDEMRKIHARLKTSATQEAVDWLKAREIQPAALPAENSPLQSAA